MIAGDPSTTGGPEITRHGKKALIFQKENRLVSYPLVFNLKNKLSREENEFAKRKLGNKIFQVHRWWQLKR
jgi:hypothetical protein